MTKEYCKPFTEKIQQATSAITDQNRIGLYHFFLSSDRNHLFYPFKNIFTRTPELDFKILC